MKRLLVIASIICTTIVSASGGNPPVTTYELNYFTFGIPLCRTVSAETADLKYQISIAALPVSLGRDWTFFFGYTHTAVWSAFSESGPFRDNTYRPGLNFQKAFEDGDILRLGFEHRSNGRPFFGTPSASEDYDDLSRGMNYLRLVWEHPLGPHTVGLEGRAGYDCGVGPRSPGEHRFTQEMFLHYIGYATVYYRYYGERFRAGVSCAPVFTDWLANVNAELSWKHFPWSASNLFVQFHYGLDETLCDCIPGARPRANLRFGFCLDLSSIYDLVSPD